MNSETAKTRDLVLVGGGHAHVQVLEMLSGSLPPDVKLTMVADQSVAYYSGMLPGCAALQYTPEEISIELRPLAELAGARFLKARVTGIDPEAQVVELEDRPPIRYDLLSVNVGSTIRGLDVPGVREYALTTRPLSRWVRSLEAFERGLPEDKRELKIVVVGGGAAGVELIFALDQRFRERFPHRELALIDRGRSLLPGASPGAAARIRDEMHARGVRVRHGAEAVQVHPHELELKDGSREPFDLLVWATGAAPHDFFRDLPLEKDERGFLLVHPSLRTVSSARILGAGDCIGIQGHPKVPKAGVFAVREGPVLARNLLRALDGKSLRPYRPQSGFLSLLNLCDGRAVLDWKGWSAQGAWVFRLKDWIDRKFMERFSPPTFAKTVARMKSKMGTQDAGEAAPMRCLGCGSKVGAQSLKEALEDLGVRADPSVLIGLGDSEDAAVIRPQEGLMVQTVDSFPAFLDDPYLMGRIAAIHAASDLYAMGAKPHTALLVLEIPPTHPRRQAYEVRQVLAGVVRETNAAGAVLVGGHTTEREQLTVGLAMTGWLPEGRSIRKGGLRVGQKLVLTKPLGSGILLAGLMRGTCSGHAIDAMVESMLLSNGPAAGVARDFSVEGMTDVTGFGLAGHLTEMLLASQLGAVLELGALPHFPSVEAILERDVRSSLDPSNRDHVLRRLSFEGNWEDLRTNLLFDPQTSGGLLLGVEPERAEELLQALVEAGAASAAIVGEVTSAQGILEVR